MTGTWQGLTLLGSVLVGGGVVAPWVALRRHDRHARPIPLTDGPVAATFRPNGWIKSVDLGPWER